MKESASEFINNFFMETDKYIDELDELSKQNAVELYEMYGVVSRHATLNIAEIDPELRAILCARQDMILERIIDIDYAASQNDIKGIYTPAVQSYRRWANVELLKDKCLAGYMLAKELKTNPVMMFGTTPADYTYADLLPGLELLYSDVESGNPNVYYEHLNKNYQKMDIMILHGMYNETITYLDAYRKFRPDGKVFCGLDMNSYWMSNINWDAPAVRWFSEQCNVIATSCLELRDALNRNPNVHFSCRWIPNAFLNSTNITITADANIKKNIILTVGRIGSAQKNNQELLLAFAKAHQKLKEWELHLVGTIDTEFKPFIAQYFEAFPYLKEKVIFTGAITDKTELYREYSEAKLFVLTSTLEGGTPNVYAEALNHGCMFVTSNIDAANEITNYGDLGQVYKSGDIDDLANALVKVTSNANYDAFQKHIPKALSYARRYYDWNRNAKKLAYMLYN
jgi:glycosyltransferase involved in cell wall biosynthesis